MTTQPTGAPCRRGHARQENTQSNLQARRCAAPRATFPEFARLIAPMNDRWDDAVPNKPQRAVEDARDETRRRHRRIARDDPQERSDTRAIPRIRAVSRQACG